MGASRFIAFIAFFWFDWRVGTATGHDFRGRSGRYANHECRLPEWFTLVLTHDFPSRHVLRHRAAPTSFRRAVVAVGSRRPGAAVGTHRGPGGDRFLCLPKHRGEPLR